MLTAADDADVGAIHWASSQTAALAGTLGLPVGRWMIQTL